MLVIRPSTIARDHRKLRVFVLADALVVDVYHASRAFPAEERFGLQSQLRRAALSVTLNIVEGSARRSTREYLNFLNVANGSAAEALYLLDVARRLSFVPEREHALLSERYTTVTRGLQAMIHALEREP